MSKNKLPQISVFEHISEKQKFQSRSRMKEISHNITNGHVFNIFCSPEIFELVVSVPEFVFLKNKLN